MVVGQLRANNWQIKSEVPISFDLGKGHMNFMKSKLAYLRKRHEAVKIEMEYRGFKCDVLHILRQECPNDEFWNDWTPVRKDTDIIRARLMTKLRNKTPYTWWRWNRKNLNEASYLTLLDRIINSETFYV